MAPWLIEATDLETQRLLRLRIRTQEGSGSVRATLRLESRRRFELSIAESLGRALWTFLADEGRSVLLDHRQGFRCRLGERLGIGDLLPGDVPLSTLPALLLGKAPIPPAAALERNDSAQQWLDDGDRQWKVESDPSGAVIAWEVFGEGRRIHFQRVAEEFRLREGEAWELAWRTVVVEGMAEPLQDLDLRVEGKADYPWVACESLDFHWLDEPQNLAEEGNAGEQGQ